MRKTWDSLFVSFEGIVDLQEFLFASNPLNPASLPAAPSIGELDGSMEITYLLSAAALDDLQIRLQSSVDLKDWAALPDEQVSTIWHDSERVEVTLMPPSDQGASFVRISVDTRSLGLPVGNHFTLTARPAIRKA